MGKREDLEAALAKAEADWRRATEALDQAQAARNRAFQAWAETNIEYGRSGADRRKAAVPLPPGQPDRRKQRTDRRKVEVERDEAGAAWDRAREARDQVRAVWDRARDALEELNRAEGKPRP
jgi:hypothetical protein